MRNAIHWRWGNSYVDIALLQYESIDPIIEIIARHVCDLDFGGEKLTHTTVWEVFR